MRLGTRGSQLALWQAHTVARLIAERGGPACEIVVVRTSGDEPGTGLGPGGTTAIGSAAPGGGGGGTAVKRLFVKELEEALADGRVDLAVHSSKDMPVDLAPGLRIGAALPREDARDALVLPATRACDGDLDAARRALGEAPRVGTSSLRRSAQLAAVLPGASFAPVRGNLDTRLRKLDEGACEALVLACAGLRRLGLAARISCPVPVDLCVPAPGQGIIAIEIRADDRAAADAAALLEDEEAADALAAERSAVQALGGGCQMPIGAHARIDGSTLDLLGVVISPDGRDVARGRVRGARSRPAELGRSLAQALLAAGAGRILDAVRRTQ
ncbi:MAG: hydroxymethylbilane synthase [Acidobacteriota bacterium]